MYQEETRLKRQETYSRWAVANSMFADSFPPSLFRSLIRLSLSLSFSFFSFFFFFFFRILLKLIESRRTVPRWTTYCDRNDNFVQTLGYFTPAGGLPRSRILLSLSFPAFLASFLALARYDSRDGHFEAVPPATTHRELVLNIPHRSRKRRFEHDFKWIRSLNSPPRLYFTSSSVIDVAPRLWIASPDKKYVRKYLRGGLFCSLFVFCFFLFSFF